MAIYPNYYGGYQPVNQQYQPQYTQYQIPQAVPQSVPQQQQNGNGINWVQGEAGAKSFIVAAGQSVLLMDSEKNAFYIKSTDPSGMPLPLRIFDYSERSTFQNPPVTENDILENYVTRQELQEFENKISQLISQRGDTENAKSNI